MDISLSENYNQLIHKISETYIQGQKNAVVSVNAHLVQTYWQIGRYIVEFEQKGKQRAEYGQALIDKLSGDLLINLGKGFSRSNLIYMRLFYLEFPISEKASHLLSWSHYIELLKISDKLERSFYLQQTILENWSIPELKRQKKSSLFLRLAASKDKEGILKLAEQGQIIEKPTDLIRDPYVLEFLKIPEPYQLSETDLETRLIDHLQHFLLELGKGFAFIGRQYRITLGNRPHYVDLVFYHRILKCFVIIDLKKEEAGYEDVGQMNMYLGYFENEENTPGDNPPIGILLAKEKDDLLVKYAMHNISSQLFVSKYQLYLPDKQTLQDKLTELLHNPDEQNNCAL
jgi:predicted nuclease of restriction endonuclease-like (RecB) superfamily